MLSKKTKYAINALTVLALQPNREPVLISEIAKQAGVPKKFLELILLELKNGGILDSKKGQGGGYFLRKEASEISLGHVIRLMSGPLAMVSCVSKTAYTPCSECVDEMTCALKVVMRDVQQSTATLLDACTLSDMANQTKALREKKQALIFHI
jgi:Rrf2 family protein